MSAFNLFSWPAQVLLGLLACGVAAHVVLAIVILVKLKRLDRRDQKP